MCSSDLLTDDDKQALTPAAQHWTANAPVLLTPLAQDAEINPVSQALRGGVAASMHKVNVPRPEGLEYLSQQFGEVAVPMMTMPLHNRAGKNFGMLCIYFGEHARMPTAERVALVEAFAGAGASAIDNQRLQIGRAHV